MFTYQNIPNHPGYRAGTDGSIWSCRNNRWGISNRWRKLSPVTNNKYGRQMIALGRGSLRYVHHVILETFVGPRPKGYECRHLDGDASNNALENLCWGTRGDNIADMRKHGRNKGANHHRAALSEQDVRQIRLRSRNGETSLQIAQSFDVGDSAIRKILRGERWSHVK